MTGTVAALAELPPGPALLGVLESVDPSSLSGGDTVDFAVAVYRLVNHVQGLLLPAVAETGIAESPLTAVRRAQPDPDFAADEIRAALVLTRSAAEGWFWLAWDLRSRLPEVQQALLSGVLDLPRARVLSEWTMELPVPAARALVAHLLPGAHRLTTGQLIDEVKRWAVAIDPDWARRRYESGLTGRRVVARRNPDGTANLGGYDLPVDRVAVAAARVDRLAKAARRAGHPDVLDHVRAEVYLGLLDGAYEALTDEEILADLLARGEQKRQAAAGDGTDQPAGEPAAAAGDQAGQPGPADQPDPAGQPGPAGESGRGGESGPADPPAGGAPEPAPPADPTTRAEPAAPAGAPTPPDPARPAGAVPRPAGGRGVEVRVRLTTMLGLDAFPGELAGWGAIHPELARLLVGENTGGQWRFVITDQAGYAIHTGLLRTRPAGSRRHGTGIVEIQVHAGLLDQPPQNPDWDPVIAELHRHTQEVTDRTGDRNKRMPGPALRRFLQVRNRTCVFPGCRMPATHTDMDHSTEHGRGGETLEGNLAPLCRHDHRARHDAAWKISHPRPGHVTWTSPLGHTYHVPAKPVIPPLPDPVPPSDKDTYDFTQRACDEHILEPMQQPEAPRPPPPTGDDDEVPPF